MAAQTHSPGPRAARLVLATAVLLFWALPCLAASERILFFESRVTVHRDGSLFVVETIRVKSLGHRFRQGLVRQFPDAVVNRFGQETPMRIQVRDVLLDGAQEPYEVRETAQGISIVTGREGEPLAQGEHTFVLSYEAYRHITHRQDFDELEWPVTGNGWSLIIDRVEAVVELPVLAFIKDLGASTGSEGASGQDYDVSFDAAGNPVFATTRRIYPGDGLVIRVSWPKGFVAQPDIVERTLDSLRDHLFLYLAALLLAVLAYRLYWRRGRSGPAATTNQASTMDQASSMDQAAPYSPLTPAMAIMARGRGRDPLAAGAVTLAALAALMGQEVLLPHPESDPPMLAPGAAEPSDAWHPDAHAAKWPGLAAFARLLLAQGPLDPASPSKALARAQRLLKRSAQWDLARRILSRLGERFEVWLLAPAALACLGLAAHNALAGLAITTFFALLTLAAPLLLRLFFQAWRAVLADEPASLAPALAWTALIAPSMAAWIVAAWFYFQDWPLAATLLLALILGLGFWLPWLRAKRDVLRGPGAQTQLAALEQALRHQTPADLLPFALALAREPAGPGDWPRILAQQAAPSAPAED